MAEPPGDPLLAGLAAGRDEAFAALYARDGAALFRVAVALLGCRADAEDAVQEVFVGLAQARASLAAVEQPAGVPVHRPAPRRGEGGRPPARPTAASRSRTPSPRRNPASWRPGRRRGWSGRWRRCRPTGGRSSP